MKFNNKNQSYIDEGISHIIIIILFGIVPPIFLKNFLTIDGYLVVNIVIDVIWLMLLISMWIATKDRIFGAIRTKKYNENQSGILKSNDIIKSKIIEIKSEGWYGQRKGIFS